MKELTPELVNELVRKHHKEVMEFYQKPGNPFTTDTDSYDYYLANAILEERLIIPINSPCYRASYNGAIEHSQGELKTWIGKWKSATKTNRELALLVENAAHALNHRPRRSLSGSNACRSYFVSDRFRYSKGQRRQAWDWIRDLAAKISAKCAKNKIDPAAWRIAARKWLERNNLIIIDRPKMGTSEQFR